MGNSSYHFIILLLVMVPLFLIPLFKILQRAGWNGWLCLLCLVPLLNLVMFWAFAFGRWPNLPDQRV